MNRLSSTCKFDFGLYRGYEVGLIFAVDIDYIRWCYDSIPDFCITDLETLIRNGALLKKKDFAARMTGDPTVVSPELNVWTDYGSFLEAVPNLPNASHQLPGNIIKINQDRLNSP